MHAAADEHLSDAITARIRSLIEKRARYAEELATQAERARRSVESLQCINDQALQVLIGDDLDQAIVDILGALCEAGRIGTSPLSQPSEKPAKEPAGEPISCDAELAATSSLDEHAPSRPEVLLNILRSRPNHDWSVQEMAVELPDISRSYIGKLLERLLGRGLITRVSLGHYRCCTPPINEQNDNGAANDTPGTLRFRVLAVMKREPDRAWRPRDIANQLHPVDVDYMRGLLRKMVGKELEQDETGLYRLRDISGGGATVTPFPRGGREAAI